MYHKNCTLNSGNLLESILFGTKKGYGQKSKPGLFEIAKPERTISLDEINSMELNVQAKEFLKLSEEKQVVPFGGYEPIKADIKVISAVNERPEMELRESRYGA